MAQYSDEEALDNLLGAQAQGTEPAAPAAPQPLWRPRKVVLSSVAVVGLLAIAWWGRFAVVPQQTKASLQFEEKVGQLYPHAVLPEEAMRRNELRKRMVVEQDLKTTLELHVAHRGRQAHFEENAGDSCFERAQRLFDEVTEESAMNHELKSDEFNVFKQRFATAMEERCKDTISERMWINAAGKELEQQKPVMTAAVVDAINAADMGFKVEMHDWLLHESVATMPHRLGMLQETKDEREDELKRPEDGKRTSEQLPAVFRAELKWPKCKEEILRIHNQGHCGSCWAFGGAASIDARMCIASDGAWSSKEDVISRLHITACGNPYSTFGHNGCMGGFPHWAMEMMATQGIASSSCLPYYIKGAGVEHFKSKDMAPPCVSHCQGGYSVPLKNDTFSSAGIANYNRYRKVNWFSYKVDIMKNAIYTEGPVAFAFHANMPFMGYKSGVFSMCHWYNLANHAVYAFGWGLEAAADGKEAVEYIEASNSWSRFWGMNGHFRLHPTCVIEVTIPGPIEKTVVNHRVGTVDSSVPRDKDNENWPWAPPEECPYNATSGCITDLEGPDGDYKNNEVCISHKLNGKSIIARELDLERRYDFLTINGKKFTGNKKHGFDLEGGILNGIVVDEHGIRFESDKSTTGGGFKICER